MGFPNSRPRRLRAHGPFRNIVAETKVTVDDFIYPLFVVPGNGIKKEISSMPGQYQFSIDMLKEEIKELIDIGIKSVIFFGIPEWKDEFGSSSWQNDGIIQRAASEIKNSGSQMFLVADVCFCEYTDHGHCGPVIKKGDQYSIDNDSCLRNLALQAISLANNGIDMLAPSGNMDGMVQAIRQSLDLEGFSNLPIMSYSVKYHSAFYGPFRTAVESAPSFGDRATYQMDPANKLEALKEANEDIFEGADILMVKPALSYLDVIHLLKDKINLPLAAYNVSGEYSMIKCAAKAGLVDEKRVVNEVLTSIKRAGADIIISYFAKDFAKGYILNAV